MAPDVRQGFLDDAVDVGGRGCSEPRRPAGVDAELGRYAGLLVEALEERSQGVDQAIAHRRLAAQVVKKFPKVVEHLSSRVLKLVNLPQNALAPSLVKLEVLEVDEHQCQRLRHPIVQLSSQRAPKLLFDRGVHDARSGTSIPPSR